MRDFVIWFTSRHFQSVSGATVWTFTVIGIPGSILAVPGCFPPPASAQVSTFPYVQEFDSVTPPTLPPGWVSSRNRVPGTDDFATNTGTPHSPPNAVLATNATIGQSISTPLIDFAGLWPDRLDFFMRRSSSFLARVVIEASVDSGTTFPILLGDTLGPQAGTDYRHHMLPVPGALAGIRGVRLQWRIIPAMTGTSGTLRIDDVTVSVKPAYDLMLAGLRFDPPLPVESEAVVALARVKNLGKEIAQTFSIRYFLDADRDSVPETDELLADAVNAYPLGGDDSLEMSVPLGSFPTGEIALIAVLDYPRDQEPANNRRVASIDIGCRRGALVVNEIMYAPAAPEPEWIEIFNTGMDSLNLRGWSMSDATISSRHTITPGNLPVPAKGFIILARDSVALREVHREISCRIVSVPGFPSLNNGGDAAVLYDRGDRVIDSVGYIPAWGGSSGGRSLERIDHSGDPTAGRNWGTSRDRSGSTPGRRNSLSRKDIDLSLDSLGALPLMPVRGDSLDLTAAVTNRGFQPAEYVSVEFYEDLDGDSTAEPGELLGSTLMPKDMAPLQSCSALHRVVIPRAGNYLFLAKVVCAGDEDPDNDLGRVAVLAGYPPAALRINEIMYAPPSGAPEWVELLNTSRDTVNLEGWRIGNRAAGSGYVISGCPLSLAPLGYCVLSKDSAAVRQAYPDIPVRLVEIRTLPTFLWSNNGDAVVLGDNRGLTVDSVRYGTSWGGLGGLSLERIDPYGPSTDSLNWGGAVTPRGATPGSANSIVLLDFDYRILKVMAGSSGAHVGVGVTVENHGRYAGGQCTVSLYHDADRDSTAEAGEFVSREIIRQPIVPRDSCSVSLRWVDPPSGVHRLIAVLEEPQDGRRSNDTASVEVAVAFASRSAVVNEIMCTPFSGDAEYVEILNPTSTTIDLYGWRISTSQAAAGNILLSERSSLLGPGEMFVVGSDSTLLRRFPSAGSMSAGHLTFANLSSLRLGNTGGVVTLMDASGLSVDSVAYRENWNNPSIPDRTGRSLERIQPLGGSNDARNWSTCVSPAGGTPGLRNSVFAAGTRSGASLTFSPNPFSPDGDGFEDFAVIHYELPVSTSLVTVRIFDVRGRVMRRLAEAEPAGSEGDMIWDGRGDDRVKVRMGIYIVLLEAINDRGGILVSSKGAIVVAGKL